MVPSAISVGSRFGYRTVLIQRAIPPLRPCGTLLRLDTLDTQNVGLVVEKCLLTVTSRNLLIQSGGLRAPNPAECHTKRGFVSSVAGV
jgi:hypothetical protein